MTAPSPENPFMTLLDVPPGGEARVVTLDQLPTRPRESLLAYGVVPGCWVQVVQHSPVTVVQVGNTELALESGLAKHVQVEQVRQAVVPSYQRGVRRRREIRSRPRRRE